MKPKSDSGKSGDAVLGVDRRGNPRFRFLYEVRVFCTGNKFIGFSYDISEGGMSFVLPENIPLKNAAVSVPNCNLILEGRLLDMQPGDKPGIFRYRFEFLKTLEDQILRDILSAAKK